MADISQDLQKILDAIYGEEVRGSIYHAISLINDVSEVILTTGTDITAPTDSSEGYYTGSLYLNLDTYELWKCVGTNTWQSLGILKGATGENGNKWYRGMAVSGKAVLPTVYPTGIANANANDYYLNPSEGAIYHCVTGGDDATATWSYDFTMTGGGGGGSIVTWTQIQLSGTKIAEVDIDGSTQDVYAPEGGGGGMLPYLYIDSEAGATVTVVQPDSTTITPTAAGSGHWECELTGGYGTYVIHSVLSGQGDATLSLAVDTVKEYHVTDTHYDFTINVTAPSGSTVRIVGGGETYTGTGTGTSEAFAVHTPSTVYTVTATQIMDGNTKTDDATVTSAATTGGSTNVTLSIEFGTITVNVAQDFITAGSTITCVNGGTSCTPKTAASTLTFRVPTTGTWTISGTISGQTYSVDAVVASLSTAVSVNLQTIPDGSTVLPTDDIQTWLNCAGIYNKTSYTTLADVLADSTTLLALMSDNNAVDYLVRSKNWITNKGLVPTMTSNTVPRGVASASSNNSNAYKVFDGDNTLSTAMTYANTDSFDDNYIQYDFGENRQVCPVYADYYGYYFTKIKFQGSNDGINFTDISDLTTVISNRSKEVIPLTATQNYRYIRFRGVSSSYGIVNVEIEGLQYYSLPSGDIGITDDSTAMTYIASNNYAADTLLADEDWFNAIIDSTNWESIINAKVPTMSSNVDVSKGEVLYSGESSTYPAWKAFDGLDSTQWIPTLQTIQDNYIGFKFLNEVAVNKISIVQRSGYYINNVKIVGSNDDFVTSVTINDNISVKEATSDTFTFLNAEKFRSYRMYINSLNGSSVSGNIFVYTLQFYGREDV